MLGYTLEGLIHLSIFLRFFAVMRLGFLYCILSGLKAQESPVNLSTL